MPKPLNITDLDISYQKELVLPTISYLNAKQIIISVKGTVHPQIIIIWLKCVIVIKVTQNPPIMVTNYIWYRRYKEIILITGGLPLGLSPMPDCMMGRRKVTWSDVKWHKDHVAIYPDQVRSQMLWLSHLHDLTCPCTQPVHKFQYSFLAISITYEAVWIICTVIFIELRV